ncbi:hypothetical protein HZS_6561, partial [Henneguya salminicola]
DFFTIFIVLENHKRKTILFPKINYRRHNIDGRYNFCFNILKPCVDFRIILKKLYRKRCIALYEVKFSSKLRENRSEDAKINNFETYHSAFKLNKIENYNKFMKNKGNYIHESTFSEILGQINRSSILNKIKNRFIFTYKFTYYEKILPYTIQNQWNIYSQLTIIKNFVYNKYFYEIKFDYCPPAKKLLIFIEKKLEEKNNYTYSRINGYGCRNPIKTYPYV